MNAIFPKRSATIALFLFLFLAVGAISYFRLLENYELESLDMRFGLRFPKIPVSNRIAIIEIGEDTLQKLGRFPFDRSYYAIIVKALSEFGVKAVIFDLLFSEPHEHDRELEEAIRASDSVYLPYVFRIDQPKKAGIPEASGYLANITASLAGSARASGHINVIPDADGKFRRVPLYIKYKGELHPYVSLRAAADYIGISGGDLKIPLDDESRMIVNFSGRWGTSYKHYSFVDVLQSYAGRISGEKPLIDPSGLKDAICIIGLTAAGTGDIHPTPFDALYPGVGIQAEVINSILNRKFIIRAPRWINLAIVLAAGILILCLTMRTRPFAGLLTAIGAVFLFSVSAMALFNLFGVWIDMACPTGAITAFYAAGTLYKYIDEWKRRLIMESELAIAKTIQESFLPKALPDIAGMEISASMWTARQVGGDLYDFVKFGDRRGGIMIGDVSGKGIPASLFMAMVSGAFKSCAGGDPNPDNALAGLNRRLVGESSSGLFVTVFYAIFDLDKMAVSYANGGHLPALYIREGERPAFLDAAEGMPLGLFEGEYSAGTAAIAKNDVFVFYTDGVTEAMDSRKRMYGKERLSSVVQRHSRLSAGKIVDAVRKDVSGFEPASEQHDDITIIAIKIT